MAIAKNYLDYLRHFHRTVTLSELNADVEKTDLIALRHDVDYDLDIALEMSYWEYRNGIRATYFVLPGSSYWQDPKLLDKCLQIQDFGHEVGLHLNVLTEWFLGRIHNPMERLEQLLSLLRSAGIKATGVSAHGDALCYTKSYINYWILKELRPDHPEQNESGLSAEGIASKGDRKQITYPKDHRLIRENGDQLSLWTIPMEQLGLDYHAVHIPHDRYFTDSGGEWKRSPDPLDADLTRGRHQILIHPEYWRTQQKIFFFLSTARSGSKWLSTVLNEATSLTSQHEFLLNHRFIEGEIIEDKRTADNFSDLLDRPDEVMALLLEIRPWIEVLQCDYAEVNVYLERFTKELTEIFPEAVLIHLHRQPCEVIRSIMNRYWYDTPEDNRHPHFTVEGWGQFSQFQKACWYVKEVNENLIDLNLKRLSFEKMVSNRAEIQRLLEALGIAFYPRLASPFYKKVINANTRNDFPEYRAWNLFQKNFYHDTCDFTNKNLGYPTRNAFADVVRQLMRMIAKQGRKVIHLDSLLPRTKHQNQEPQLLGISMAQGSPSHGTQVEVDNDELTLHPQKGANAYFLFGGGNWHTIDSASGWEAQRAHYYRGTLEAKVKDSSKGTARLICLTYDKSGKLIGRRPLVRLRKDKSQLAFAFRPGSDADRFNLTLYMPSNDLPKMVTVRALRLEKLPLGHEGLTMAIRRSL